MSELSTTPAATSSMSIHSLDHDILIYIFTHNADMFADKHALHTTRITSQVCHEWRELLLGASFLWARLIDIDLLQRKRLHVWRNELILRTGGAPLWIRLESDWNPYLKDYDYPFITVEAESISHFICRIISDNWHRIQKLVLKGACWDVIITPSTLCSPAPYLQTLVIPIESAIVQTKDSGENGSPTSIFADQAPSLRVLSLRGYRFNYREPWLFQLHILHLNGEYSVGDALSILSVTHSLRQLQLSLNAHSDTPSPISTVYLPRLQCLQLHVSHPHQGAKFLGHIGIPSNCLLAIRSLYSHRLQLTPADYLPLINIFSHYARQHSLLYQSKILSLDCIGTNQISWKCRTFSPGMFSEVGIRFSLPESIVPSVIEMVLKSHTSTELSKVSTIHFRGWVVWTFPRSASVRDFFMGLTSLHTLYSDDSSLECLMKLQEDMEITIQPGIILPSLSVVYLELFNCCLATIPVKLETAEFFLSRQQYGYPVSTLNLTLEDSTGFDNPPNVDALKDVRGLRITYKPKPTSNISS